MVVTRTEAFKKELIQMKKECEKEKKAHTATKQEVVDLSIRMGDLRRLHEAAGGDLQLLALRCRLQEVDEEAKGETIEVYTDDVALHAILPEAPIHDPKSYRARPKLDAQSFDTSPSVKTESTGHLDHFIREKEVNDTVSSAHGSKRTFDEMNSDESNDNSEISKLSPSRRIVMCIRCYQRKLRCNSGEPCNNCATVKRVCKRAKCNDYENGTCR